MALWRQTLEDRAAVTRSRPREGLRTKSCVAGQHLPAQNSLITFVWEKQRSVGEVHEHRGKHRGMTVRTDTRWNGTFEFKISGNDPHGAAPQQTNTDGIHERLLKKKLMPDTLHSIRQLSR